jgi:hypothetical protein
VHKVFSITNQPLARDQLAAFFFIGKIRNFKIQKSTVFGVFQSPEVSKSFLVKIARIIVLGFQCVAKI